MKKITFEEFKRRVESAHGDKFEISINDFDSTTKPLKAMCLTHREQLFVKKAYQLVNNNPCKKCRTEEKFNLYQDRVKQALKEYFPEFKLMSNASEFNGEVSLYCSTHGNFKVRADGIIFSNKNRRINCPKCRTEQASLSKKNVQKVTFEDFYGRFERRYGSKLKLLSTSADYQNLNSLLKVKCSNPNHEPFCKTAKDLLRYNGCRQCNESWGERLVRIALEDLGINYEQEKRFLSCRDRKELPFDFWLPDFATLIEFQGLQHREAADRFGGDPALTATKKRDKIKKVWAHENGLNLIYVEGYQDIKRQIVNYLNAREKVSGELIEKLNRNEERWAHKKWCQYLEKLKKVHCERYDFSASRWAPGQKHISYRCPEHGETVGNLQSLLKGHGCSLCANNKMTLDLVIKRSRERFGQKFDFEKTKFTKMTCEFEIICDVHGVIRLTPERHFNLANGCMKCSTKSPNRSSKKFLERARHKFEERFDYKQLNYHSASEKIVVRCELHDISFKILPGDHLRNETGGCPLCVSESKAASHGKPIMVLGVEHNSLAAAARFHQINAAKVRRRLKLGWSVDRAFTE